MLWLIKAALIIIYFSYTAIHYKLSILKKLFIPVIIISMPVFRSDTVNYEKMIALGLITTLLMLSLKFSKYIFTGMAVIVIATSVLYFNGILGTNLHLDSGRTIMVDAGYASRINQLRSQSLYLPYKLRPVLFNNWSYLLDNIGRTLNILWFDSLTGSIGLLASLLLIPEILKKENFPACLLVFIGASVCAVSRNPDISTVYLLLTPPLIGLAVSGLASLSL